MTSRVSSLISATLLTAAFIFSGGGAKANNVLVNPGAEAGKVAGLPTGWNASLTGYIYVVSTNSLINGAGSGNILVHSGSNVFQLFNTTGNTTYIYQDFATIAGSQWSASCYAICYASNYFQPGADAHMEMVFFDSSNNVVVSTNSSSGTAGTYGSDFLDPIDIGFPWIFTPPQAVDASGWVYLQATNLYNTVPASEASYEYPLTDPVSAIQTAPPGTAVVRYQIEFDNSATMGGAVYFDDCDLEEVTPSDPDISNPPVAQTVYAGSPASFSVTATHTQTGEKLHYQWQFDGTNLPAAGGVNDISGSTTTSLLSFTNCSSIAAGQYDVVVTVTSSTYTNSIRSVPVPLTVLVLSPLQKANVLGANFGFEGNPAWPLWNVFNGAYFATAASTYDDINPVNVLDGSSVCLVGANGDRDNGFWQAVSAAPGSIWKAGGWAYISSFNDFLDGNTCRLQIWFKDSFGTTVPGTSTYESFKLYGLGYTNSDAQYTSIDTSSPVFGQVGNHVQLARDSWVYLPVTNVVNNGGIGLGDDLPYNTLPNGTFMVPTNAAEINFQVYEYCPQGSDVPTPQADLPGNAADAVYWDDMELIQVVPVTDLKAAVGGGNVNLSFSAGAGLVYAVLYKTNLTDATWNVLTNVAAPLSWQTNTAATTTTYPMTVSDSLAAHSRFYRVQSQ